MVKKVWKNHRKVSENSQWKQWEIIFIYFFYSDHIASVLCYFIQSDLILMSATAR